jgi:small-conductance mechanosensitive channel
VSLALLLLGVFIHIVLALLVTILSYPLVRKLCLGKCLAKRESFTQTIKDKCRETEIRKQEVLKLLTDAGMDEWKKDFEDFVNTCSRRTRQDKISWENISKLLFGIAKVSQERARDTLDQEVESTLTRCHNQIRKLIRVDTMAKAASAILPVATFFVFYWFFGALLVISRSSLGASLLFDWWVSLSLVLLAWSAAVALYYFMQFFIKSLTEKTRTQLDDVLAVAISFPSSAALGAILFAKALASSPAYFQYAINRGWRLTTAEPLTLALTTIIVTFLLLLVFNRVIIYVLQRWAASTKQTFDDMAVRMLQIFGTFIILAVVGAVLIIRFQAELRAVMGIENILLPYAIVVGVLTGLLGYATKEGVENFFGGLLLQIDKPFNIGDRLMLDSGEICDVREIGMRGTRLYNVLDNSEISIPNRIMVTQKITNISEPDVQLRIPITIQLGYNKFAPERVDAVLLDIAYGDPEVEQARVNQQEISQEQRDSLGRLSLEEHWHNLVTECPGVKDVKVERILGRGKYEQVLASNMLRAGLEDVVKLRTNLGKVLDRETNVVNKAAKQIKLDVSNLSDIRGVLLNAAMQATSLHANTQTAGALMASWIEAVIHKDSLSKKTLVKLIGRSVTSVSKQGSADFLLGEKVAKTGKCRNDELYQLLKACGEWYSHLRGMRYLILMDITRRFGEISEAIYSVRDALPDIRTSTDAMVNELLKEPSVYSQFQVTDEGLTYIEISFRVFTSHLERKFEVTHRMHKAIGERFRQEGIPLGLPKGTT